MDKVITTALLIIASVVAAMTLVNAVIPAMGKTSGALTTANSAVADRIKTDIDVVPVTGNTATNKITAWVKNIGTKSIKPVNSTDVILTTPTGVTRLSYVAGCSSECWDYVIEGGIADWRQAATVKFTLATTVATGAYSISVVVFNAVTASKDFSV